MDKFNTKKYFSTAQASHILGVSPDTLRRLSASGKVKPRNVNGVKLFCDEDLIVLSRLYKSKDNTQEVMLSIKDAATWLGVSIDTIRRWEKIKKIQAIRTIGGHRRYKLSDIKFLISSDFRPTKTFNFTSEDIKTSQKSQQNTTQVDRNISSQIIRPYTTYEDESLIRVQKRLLKGTIVLLALLLLLPTGFGARYLIASLSENSTEEVISSIPSSVSRVLQAASESASEILAVNIPAIFRSGVNFEAGQDTVGTATFEDIEASQNITTDADLAVNGGDITSTATNLNIGTASTAGTTTITNNLAVSGTLDVNGTGTHDIAGTLNLSGNNLSSGGDLVLNLAGGNLTFTNGQVFNVGGSGSHTAYNTIADSVSTASSTMNSDDDLYIEGSLEVDGSLVIGSDTISDITGSGLQVSGGALETTLGGDISTDEILDSTILEVDLAASNTATDGYALTYNSATGGFTWASTGASSSGWTDSGTTVELTTATDIVNIGTYPSSGPSFVGNFKTGSFTTSTATSGANRDFMATISADPASAPGASTTYRAGQFQTSTASSSAIDFTNATIYGTLNQVFHQGTNSLGSAYGSLGSINNTSSGTMTAGTSYAATLSNSSTGTISVGYGFFVDSPTNSGGGTLSQYNGIYVSDITAASGSNNFALRTNAGLVVFNEGGDSSTDLRIEGDNNTHLLFTDADVDRIGINDSTPDAKLEILSTTEQLRLTHTDGTIDSRIAVDSNGDLTIDGSSDGSGSETFTLTGYSTFNCTDCLDFDDMENTLDVDETTDINLGANALTIDLDSSGDFSIRDVTTDILTFYDDGTVVFNETGTATQDIRIEGDTNENLLFTQASTDRVGINDATPDAKLDVDYTITGTTSADMFGGLLTNQTSSGTQRGLVLTNADDAANAITESLIALDNAEGTADTITDYIKITATTADVSADAIDVSDTELFNGLNLGQNFLLGSGIRQFSSSSTVWTFEDTDGNDLCTITDGGTTGTFSCTGGSFASTLQNAYDNDANGSDTLITLSSSDDSLVFTNPAASGTDSAFTIQVDNSSTGNATNNFKNLNVTEAGSFTTAGGNITNYGAYVSNTSTESAGGNVLTNIGLYATASGADTNYAAIFEAGNVGVGTTGPDRKLDVLDASNPQLRLTQSDSTNYSDFQTNSSGDLAVTATGGDVTVGTSTSEHNLQLYGDLTTQASAELNASMTNIKDVYIYDTTKDSDQGEWTTNSTSQQLSWYTETKDDGPSDACVIDTDDRCGASYFPKKATIVATTTDVYIFDTQTNTQWMNFDQGSSLSIGDDTNNNPSSVWAQDGVVYVGTNGSSGTGLYAIDFKRDKLFRYDSSNRSDSGLGRITDRNSSITYSNSDTNMAINSSLVNDIHVNTIRGEIYVAVATDSELSLIRPNQTVVHDYSDTSGDDYNSVWITSTGRLIGLNETAGQAEQWGNTDLDMANEIGGTPDKIWDESSTPALANIAPTIGVSPSALFVKEKVSNTSYADALYIGTSTGLTVINNTFADTTNASATYYNTTYISEEMYGDIRGMFPFSGSGAIATNTSVGEASLKQNILTSKNANGTGMTYASGIRGNGITFDNTDDHLCSDTNGDNTCDNDTDYNFGSTSFSVTGWFKHSTSAPPAQPNDDVIIDHTYNTTPAAVLGWKIWMNQAGTISFGLDDDAVWTNGDPTDDQLTSTATYLDNTWHHFAATKLSDEEAFLYIDGVLVANDTSLATTGVTGTGVIMGVGSDCSTGAACATGANFWDGSLDDITLTAEYLRADQIRTMYLTGRKSTKYRTISVSNATAATSTTIADSGETWTPNEFVGAFVEITFDTGAGQTRRIIKNTATELTVSPAWTTTPDTTSDFAINPSQLYGESDNVEAVTVTEDARQEISTIYVGTDSGSQTGGVTAIQKDGDYITDLYHSDAGKTDDGGTAFNNSNYDDIQALSSSSEAFAIAGGNATTGAYWQEYKSKGLTQKVDDLNNQTNQIQLALPGLLSDTHRQNDTQDTTVSYQIIRKGWGHVVGDGVNNRTSEALNFNITFDDIPIVLENHPGQLSGADPAFLEDCSSADGDLFGGAYLITPRGFTAVVTDTGATALSATIRYCYTWLAIGSFSTATYGHTASTWAGGADLAEWYQAKADEGGKLPEAGEVVSVSKAGDISVAKSGKSYDPGAIGIVATKPAITIGPENGLTPSYKDDTASPTGQSVAVGLAGRVPVKVSLEGGAIKAGDPLTTSSTPGLAMKATKAGPIIGKAMEDFDGTSTIVALAQKDAEISSEPQLTQGSGPEIVASDPQMAELDKGHGVVMAFINTGWYDPDPLMTSSANLSLKTFVNDKLETMYALVKTAEAGAEETVERIGAFSEIASAKIKTGVLSASETITDKLQAGEAVVKDLFADRMISPVTETSLIKPFGESGDVAIQIGQNSEGDLEATSSGKLSIQNEEGSEIASVDTAGNASFEGEIEAKSATISGELRAGKIYADEIITTNNENKLTYDELVAQLTDFEQVQNNLTKQIASMDSSDVEADVDAKAFRDITTANLYVTDTAAVNVLSVTKSIAIGPDLILASDTTEAGTAINHIDSVSAPLHIQYLALAPLGIMADKVVIDTDGNVTILEDLKVAGKTTTSELSAERLIIANPTQNEEERNLESEIELGLSGEIEPQIESTSTVGSAKIPAGATTLTIKNINVTKNSFIYLTPTSETQNLVLYIKEKGEGFFKVGFNEEISEDVEFNWWIVDTVNSN